ncbi:ribonuclease R [Kyrpidia spormannii]|uniref:Ribonuclease R n=1 Tax=Kyrpidia spormannii TaxID=2055160 RepID=A0A6F9E1Z2_9BACL|nr:ribonuclease R [Kyrpidia spormannii]CAB3390842.1 ribonuclease R [Kyrpidia spormannii]
MNMEEQILSLMRELSYKPMAAAELQRALHIQEGEQEAFLALLQRMEENGQVVRTRTHRYGVPERMNLLVGRLQMKQRGYGFVIPDRPGIPDLYVSSGDLGGAMHGDRVVARIQQRHGERAEGEVIRILERALHTVVGTFQSMRYYAFVRPDDRRIPVDVFIAPDDFGGANDGDKVVVEITVYPERATSCQGRVIEVLGRPGDPGVDVLAVVRKYELPEEFPDDVMAESERVPETVQIEDLVGRRDLRDRAMVTIDGEDAKDLDDAVSLERLPNGNWLLGVHIADVSYYVKEGSALDEEAFRRGCSVYLVDRVIPMLPPRLSNGICSLNPRVDRLAMTCDMEWTPDLRRVHHEIYPSVIRTRERMTYTAVRRILEEDPELAARYEPLVPMFRHMRDLAMALRKRRLARGAVDFHFDETKVILDESGKPVDIVRKPQTVAEQIIEEFMLAANETVAEHFQRLEVPFLYRVHEDPDPEKIEGFKEFIWNLGYVLRTKGGRAEPRALQEILEQVRGKPEERVVNTILLRSMRQARYSHEGLGHFGLAAEFYTHFTSPIRRYPDLVIHRVIREWLREGGLPPTKEAHWRAEMPRIADQSSERERVAVDAERESQDLKKVEFMLDKVGETFEGIVSGVTSFGLFVELENSVEGLVHISYLTDDYYRFDDRQFALIGERTGRNFRIGDRVKVLVAGADKEERTIDFRLVEESGEGQAEDAEAGAAVFRPAAGSGGRSRRKKKVAGAASAAVGRAGARKSAGSGRSRARDLVLVGEAVTPGKKKKKDGGAKKAKAKGKKGRRRG